MPKEPLHSLPSLWPAYKRILQRSSLPILAGPFLGECGIECLYWLSFLEHLKQSGVDPKRIIPIARSGSAAWYGCPTGVEVYAMRSLQAIRVQQRIRRMTTGLVKQMHANAFDRDLTKDAAASLGLTRYHRLHPAWMYQTLAPYWNGQKGLDWFHQRATYAFLLPPPVPEGLTLPPEFVAVRFYFRATFEYKHDALQLAKHTVKRLASQWPVILLNTGLHADDHQDLEFKQIPNVQRLGDLIPITAENSLGVQSAVLGRSLGFVGTYGGLAQLAQRLAKPAVTFYTSWGGTSLAHKHLSDAISLRSGIPFVVHAVKDLHLLGSVLPEAAVEVPLTTNSAPLADAVETP